MNYYSVALRLAQPAPEDDATLVARFAAGEVVAFDQLYDRHVGYVAGVAFRLLGDQRELNDVLQETFLAALETMDKLREPARVRAWLVGIAIRRVRRRLYKRARWAFIRRVLGAGAPVASDPEDRARVDELGRALSSVDPKFQTPWVLHHVEGETLPVVAEIEGVSLATIKRRIARADVEIRRLLDEA